MFFLNICAVFIMFARVFIISKLRRDVKFKLIL